MSWESRSRMAWRLASTMLSETFLGGGWLGSSSPHPKVSQIHTPFSKDTSVASKDKLLLSVKWVTLFRPLDQAKTECVTSHSDVHQDSQKGLCFFCSSIALRTFATWNRNCPVFHWVCGHLLNPRVAGGFMKNLRGAGLEHLRLLTSCGPHPFPYLIAAQTETGNNSVI